MICKNTNNNILYNYSFVEDGKVLLENKYDVFSVNYEDWIDEYIVIDKWKCLTI